MFHGGSRDRLRVGAATDVHVSLDDVVIMFHDPSMSARVLLCCLPFMCARSVG